MLSALSWLSLFIVAVAVAMSLRERVRSDEGVRALYERVVKDRLNLLKKIVIYGTIVLWAIIWLATRGDEKADIGNLLQDFSKAWTKQEKSIPPAIEKE